MGKRLHTHCLIALLVVLGIGPVGAQTTTGAPTPPPRMPIRNGATTVKVACYDDAHQNVVKAALDQSAELLEARTLVNEKGKKHGWLRFRVTADRLPALLSAVHNVGKLYAENITTSDPVSEYEDLARRVGRLREHQQRLAALLQSGRRLRGSDILYIQERLLRSGVDEGLLLQRRIDLQRATQVSTLLVHLFEPGALPALAQHKIHLGRWFASASVRALADLNRFLARGATALAYGLVWAPLWLPLLVLVALTRGALWRSGKRAGTGVAFLWGRWRAR